MVSAMSQPVPAAVLGAVLVTFAYLVAFPYRQDYAAHVAGGYALALLAAGGLGAAGRHGTWAPVWALAAGVTGAVAAELTIFGGIVDLVEVSISALGAGLAAAVLHRFFRGCTTPPATVVLLGSLTMVVAVMLRFEIPWAVVGG